MDKLNADGSLQVSTFDRIGQSLSAIAKGPLGSFMKGVGGLPYNNQMGFDVKANNCGKIPVLGKLFDKLPYRGGYLLVLSPTKSNKNISSKRWWTTRWKRKYNTITW